MNVVPDTTTVRSQGTNSWQSSRGFETHQILISIPTSLPPSKAIPLASAILSTRALPPSPATLMAKPERFSTETVPFAAAGVAKAAKIDIVMVTALSAFAIRMAPYVSNRTRAPILREPGKLPQDHRANHAIFRRPPLFHRQGWLAKTHFWPNRNVLIVIPYPA